MRLVITCLDEPIPGWLENYSGPTGIITGIANGVLRTMICEQDMVFDIIPVDTVINVLIATAWQTAINKAGQMKVYNCVSCRQNPITWGEFFVKTTKYILMHPLEGVLWYPTLTMYTNKPLQMLTAYMVQYIPAHFIDLFSWTMGKRSM